MEKGLHSCQTFGIMSFASGFISVFFIAPLFGALAILTGGIGLFKQQRLWSIAGIVFAIIGLITSPLFWMLVSDRTSVNLTLTGQINSKQLDAYVNTEQEGASVIKITYD